MNDFEWNEIRSIFDKRGVSREVAQARPYVPYERGAAWVTADGGPYDAVPPEQRRSTVLQDVRGAGGLIMFKTAVPLSVRKLTEFPPQLRPTPDPVTGSIVNHDHRDPWMSNSSMAWHVDGVHRGDDVRGLHDNYRQELHDHDALDDDGRPIFSRRDRGEHVKGRAHHGIDAVGPHPNGEPGKYKLPPSPLIWESWLDEGHPHNSARCRHRRRCLDDRQHTAKHVAKHHRHDPALPADGEPHVHVRRKKNRGISYGKRLDVHPLGRPLLADAEAVFVSMEGNLKADSILTRIRRDGRPWAIVDVPSVAQWQADELDEFAAEHLAGRQVFLICDSDWSTKYDVQRQAFAFREYLRRHLGIRAQVAAPPQSDEFEPCPHPNCPNPEQRKIGVDDWLADPEYGGYGGSLEDLTVLDRRVARMTEAWSEAWEWFGTHGDRRQRRSHGLVVSMMTLLSDADGYGRASVKSLAGFMAIGRGRVTDALSDATLESTDHEHPIEWLTSEADRYRRERRELHDLGDRSYDTFEWQIRPEYRWQQRRPRTVGSLLR